MSCLAIEFALEEQEGLDGKGREKERRLLCLWLYEYVRRSDARASEARAEHAILPLLLAAAAAAVAAVAAVCADETRRRRFPPLGPVLYCTVPYCNLLLLWSPFPYNVTTSCKFTTSLLLITVLHKAGTRSC